MIDAGLVVATFALVMVVWNIGLAKKSMHEWRDECLFQSEELVVSLEDDDPRYQSLAEIIRLAKRREHFEGLPPGTLTPHPWRSVFYGPSRHSFRSIPSDDVSSLTGGISGGQHTMVG